MAEPSRGGKTVAGAMKSVLLSIMFPNRGLIGRKDMTDLKDTSLTTFFDICPPELILDHHRGDRKIVIRTSEMPSEILYRGLGDQGDVEKSKGIDLGWAWIDEPSEIEPDTYLMLRSQLNWLLPDGNRPLYMMLLTSNPEPGWMTGPESKVPRSYRTSNWGSRCDSTRNLMTLSAGYPCTSLGWIPKRSPKANEP
jgi:phage terminase large subunit